VRRHADSQHSRINEKKREDTNKRTTKKGFHFIESLGVIEMGFQDFCAKTGLILADSRQREAVAVKDKTAAQCRRLARMSSVYSETLECHSDCCILILGKNAELGLARD